MAQTQTEPIIEVSNLTACYGTDLIFDDISFNIKRGELEIDLWLNFGRSAIFLFIEKNH